MKITEIFEARRNPELNPKTPINDYIINAVESTNEMIAGIKNVFVSFTSIEKLGINPGSEYATPLGIYSYPAEYVVAETGATKPMAYLPFAGGSPFVNIFSASGEVINLTEMTIAQARELNKKVAQYWASISGKDWKSSVDDIEEFIVHAQDSATFSDYAGGQFWYVTYRTASLMAEKLNTTAPRAWNMLFRKIGIAGCVDTGVGIIHTSEPTQAVFFSIDSIKNVKRYHNAYSPDMVEKKKNIKAALDVFNDPNQHIDKFIDFFRTIGKFTLLQYIPSSPRRLELLAYDPYLVAYFKKPTEQELIYSLLRHPTIAYGLDDSTITTHLNLKLISQFNVSDVLTYIQFLSKRKKFGPAEYKEVIARFPHQKKVFDDYYAMSNNH